MQRCIVLDGGIIFSVEPTRDCTCDRGESVQLLIPVTLSSENEKNLFHCTPSDTMYTVQLICSVCGAAIACGTPGQCMQPVGVASICSRLHTRHSER
eukprot:m.733716 g.733716  ORF g.733716 m.733716 type:complete len:97 (+) comp23074_c0_seq3:84-374(+)